MKILITGGPDTGKTTLAATIPLRCRSTDTLGGTWDQRVEAAATWLGDQDTGIIEGVIVPHALELWMRLNQGKPADQLIILTTPHTPQSKGQTSLSKSIRTILSRIEPELIKRGVEVRYITQ